MDRMLKFWKSLSYTTKFSIIAFMITAALGFGSMGFLGLGLYYPVAFLFSSYRDIDNWHGDWIWPTIIIVGMLWSLGFIIAGVAWHYLIKKIGSLLVLRVIYILVLWLWAAFLWYWPIAQNADRL